MKIAITGGIGSGKSEVMKILSKECNVYSADEINANLLKNKEYISEIDNHFMGAVVNGAVDKSILRGIVFSAPEKRELLNSIAHPRIREEIVNLPDGAFVEVPLLFESGMQDIFDIIIVVYAKRETRVQRIMTRGIEREVAEKIIDSQYPDEYKIANSTYAIENNGDLDELKNKVISVLSGIKNAGK